jgi:hypothetical protein
MVAKATKKWVLKREGDKHLTEEWAFLVKEKGLSRTFLFYVDKCRTNLNVFTEYITDSGIHFNIHFHIFYIHSKRVSEIKILRISIISANFNVCTFMYLSP